MSAIKGDFIGFTFNGIHSSELGIMRVSDGSRYNENLFPTIQDKTAQVPGADGTYYFGSYYTQLPISISIAFDDLSEEQFQRIRRVFGDKKIHDLIFDEAPYKVYRVKTTGSPNLKYICFEKGLDEFDRDYQTENQIKTKEDLYGIGARSPFGRIYKGEGQLNFVCYTPFARSRFKYLDDYTIETIPEWGTMDNASANSVYYNLYDWADASGMVGSQAGKEIQEGDFRQIDKVRQDGILIYNPGNFPVHFNLIFTFTGTFKPFTIGVSGPSIFGNHLNLQNFGLKAEDIGIRINGKLNLIEGIKEVRNSEQYVKVKRTANMNPVEEGWYEYINEKYRLSSDTLAGLKDYYERQVKYEPTGNIYNEYIESGDFFKLPMTNDLEFLPMTFLDTSISPPQPTVPPEDFRGKIEYDYLYY